MTAIQSANKSIVKFRSSENMKEIKAQTVDLIIASPPFTNQAGGNTLDKQDFLAFLGRTFTEMERILKPGGFLVSVNTDLRDHARYNGGNPYYNGLIWHKHGSIRRIATELGLRHRDSKIWVKTLRRNVYRYTFSYVLFFQKPAKSRNITLRYRVDAEFGADVWLLEGGTRRRDSRGFIFRDAIHPSIVQRCIGRLTHPGDLVVSPFTGSGTVLAVASMMDRNSIGYEINTELARLIRESIEHPQQFPAYKHVLATLCRA